MVRVEFDLEPQYVERLRSVVRKEGIPQISKVNEWCRDLVVSYFEDKRRSSVVRKRVQIQWLLEVYTALVKHVESFEGCLPGYVREAVYSDLRLRTEEELSPPPLWRDRRAKTHAYAYKKKKGREREHCHAVMIPSDWAMLINQLWPGGNLSPYLMACTQARLQKETGVLYEVKNGKMERFMAEYKAGITGA
ncbi:MAG: hypothetical protein R3C59_24780 [Planctomycetaceae bacterium]